MRFCIKFIPLLMLPLLCACAREEWPAGEMIRFSVDGVSAELQTKGEDPIGPDKDLGLTDAEKNTFVLWGEMTQHATPPDWSAATTVFTNRKAVKADGLWNYWGTGLPERWTRTNDYRFRAVYPATADVNQGESSGAMLTVDYSMFENEERDVNDQVTKRKGNYDLMVASASVADAANQTDPVLLNFHHACAVVQVLFKTGTPNTYLTDFSLQNLHATGTLRYSGTSGVAVADWTRNSIRIANVFPWAGKTKAKLRFLVNWGTDPKTVTVTKVTTAAQDSNPDESDGKWLEYGDGKRMCLYKDSTDPTIFEITVDFDSDWGFRILDGTRVYGSEDGTLLSLSTAMALKKNGMDINFEPSDITSHWEVPTDDFAPITGRKWYFVIPQDLNEADNLLPAVQFSYSVGQRAPLLTTLELPLKMKVGNSEDNIIWEAGKVYTYKVQIQPKSTITVSVEDWESFYVTTDDIVF